MKTFVANKRADAKSDSESRSEVGTNVVKFPSPRNVRRAYLLNASIWLDRNAGTWTVRIVYRCSEYDVKGFAEREDAMRYLGVVMDKLSLVEAL